MTKEESEQIAKMCGALLIYNPHGAPTTAQDLPIHQYAEFVEQVVRMNIIKRIQAMPEDTLMDIEGIFNIIKEYYNDLYHRNHRHRYRGLGREHVWQPTPRLNGR